MTLRTPTAIVLVVCTASCAAFVSRPTSLKQLLFVVALILIPAIFLTGAWNAARQWNKLRLAALSTPLLALCAAPVGIGVGRIWRSWEFDQNLSMYLQAAHWALSQQLANDTTVLEPPPEFQSLAYAIHVQHDATCGALVDFFWGSGFPVKHTIRRYAPDSSQPTCSSPNGYAHKLDENWYEFAQ